MSIQRLVPLTLGWQELDRCIALNGYPPGEGDRIPIPGWVIERDGGGLILYDTGYDPTAGASELAFPGFPPPEVVALPDALAAAAAGTQKNLTERIARGILLAGREQALASIDRFKEAAAAVGALMIPGHDPEVWGLLPRSFGASRGPHSVAVP